MSTYPLDGKVDLGRYLGRLVMPKLQIGKSKEMATDYSNLIGRAAMKRLN